MTKSFFIFLLLFFCSNNNPVFAQQQIGSIIGRLVDFETGEAVPFVNIYLTIKSVLVGAQTDFDGYYCIKPIPIGTYHINFEMYQYEKLRVSNVPVFADSTTVLHAVLAPDSLEKSREMAYQTPKSKDILVFNFLLFTKVRNRNTSIAVAPNCFAAPSFWEKEKNKRRSLRQTDWQREIERAIHKTNNHYIFE